jgi:transposase
VIGIPGNVRVYLACGVTDMRKGFDGLAARVQLTLQLDPHGGALFVFRGRRGDLIKVLWWDGQGLCLFAKRLEHGRFLWPQAKDGSVVLTAAQLSMLLEGIDWRAPRRSQAAHGGDRPGIPPLARSAGPMKAGLSARGSRTPKITARPRIWFSRVTRWPTSFLRAMISDRTAWAGSDFT